MKSPFRIARSGIGPLTSDGGPSHAGCKKKGAMDISTPLFIQKQKGPWAAVLPTVPDFFIRRYSFKNRELRRQTPKCWATTKVALRIPKITGYSLFLLT